MIKTTGIVGTLNRNFTGYGISNREILNITKKEDTLILTCKLGNEIINCYDGTHNKEQLKKWASKKILLCPVCGKPYEYCHGEVKTPYFRHMDKNVCEDKYSESETEEHIKGKRDLYEWIKKQIGVTNAVLEGWIPETKQRPDIIFEHKGKKYVIEYQCSPIASEYVERHELYKASGIIDIWILGTEKYLHPKMRKKYIQNYSYGFYSYKNKNLFPIRNSNIFSNVKLSTVKRETGCDLFYGLSLNGFVFDSQIYHYCFKDIDKILEKKKQRRLLQISLNKAITSKRHNKYLNLQYQKTLENIKRYLHSLSNKNWRFDIDYSHYNNQLIRSIIAEPIITGCVLDYKNNFYNYKKENYVKINLEKLKSEKYDDFKCCGKDVEFLKSILLPIMVQNKNVVINFESNFLRIMEVRDN